MRTVFPAMFYSYDEEFKIKSVLWIRIRSDSHSFGSVDPDPDPDPEVSNEGKSRV